MYARYCCPGCSRNTLPPPPSCRACGTALVDDGRGAPYDAATDDGTPHVCPTKD